MIPVRRALLPRRAGRHVAVEAAVVVAGEADAAVEIQAA
jgi:hypothetical protein